MYVSVRSLDYMKSFHMLEVKRFDINCNNFVNT